MRFIVVFFVMLLGACAKQTLPAKDSEKAATAPQKPNIIVFFADDLGYGDLGSYGHPSIRTPNLDSLAAEGQRWTDFYTVSAVCSPSRGALLTGQYPLRSGLYGKRIPVMFPNDPFGIPAGQITLAEALQSAGYATGIIGKWHLGDAPDAYPTRHGFDYWYGLPYSNDMDWTQAPDFTELLEKITQGKSAELAAALAQRQAQYFSPRNDYWDVPLIRSIREAEGFTDTVLERPAAQEHLTGNATREAIGFIRDNTDRPFFLYVPYAMPHVPLFRSEAFVGKSRAGLYGDVVEELDHSVGTILSTIRQLNLADNTLVVFTSDNGPWLSMKTHGGSAGLLRNGKSTTFEGGMRVPAIFWWPGQVKPAVIHDIGSTLDIFTTLLAFAGVSPPAETDGINLAATLSSAAPSARTSLAYYFSGELRAYRKGPYKLHLVTQGAYGQLPERVEHDNPLLFHLGRDPGENHDIAAQYPHIVADILREIEAHKSTMTQQPPLFDRRLAQ